MHARINSTKKAAKTPSGLDEMTRLMGRSNPIHEFFNALMEKTIGARAKGDCVEILL